MPGGSASGITTMFTVTFVSLAIKRIWSMPMVYGIYGIIGLISHLLVGDWLYMPMILSVVMLSLFYNWIVHKYHYSIAAYLILLPLYVIILQYLNFIFFYLVNNQKAEFIINPNSVFLSALFGCTGIILAYLCYFKWNNHHLITGLLSKR
jgi:hypothetical protein